MSGMTKFDICRIFRENMIIFSDALVAKFPNEKDLILLRIVIEDAPVEPIILSVADLVIPYSDIILTKNDKFFLEKCSQLLKGIVPDSVELDHFKRIWLSPDFSNEDKEEMWRWFKLFLKLTQKYTE